MDNDNPIVFFSAGLMRFLQHSLRLLLLLLLMLLMLLLLLLLLLLLMCCQWVGPEGAGPDWRESNPFDSWQRCRSDSIRFISG